jgi:hypothetical protein
MTVLARIGVFHLFLLIYFYLFIYFFIIIIIIIIFGGQFCLFLCWLLLGPRTLEY